MRQALPRVGGPAPQRVHAPTDGLPSARPHRPASRGARAAAPAAGARGTRYQHRPQRRIDQTWPARWGCSGGATGRQSPRTLKEGAACGSVPASMSPCSTWQRQHQDRAAWPAVMARVACSGENAIGVMANDSFCTAQTYLQRW